MVLINKPIVENDTLATVRSRGAISVLRHRRTILQICQT